MGKEPNLNRFEIILTKGKDEFQSIVSGSNEELITNLLYFLKEDNIKSVVEIIKRNEKSDKNSKGNVLNNLLQLEPISLPIIDKFFSTFASNDTEKNEEFYDRVEKTLKISSELLNKLEAQRIKFEQELSNSRETSIEKVLKDVIKEVNKHSKTLKQLKEKDLKDNELTNLKRKIAKIEDEMSIKNIDELKNKLKDYQLKKEGIDKIKSEIEESKNLFKDLPKDWS